MEMLLKSVASVHSVEKEVLVDFKWYLFQLNSSEGYTVKLMLEEGAKHLGLDECLDRVIVLASYKEDGLFYGGDLSGYALIRCRLVSKLYYLLSAIPQVYGMLESPNRRKKGYTPIQELMNEVPDEEVYRLIEGMMKKRKFWLEEGKEVLIKDGAFKGFKGVVISCVDTKVVLEIPIMGRTVKTTTTLDNLVKS